MIKDDPDSDYLDCVVDPPHEDREKRVIGAEELPLRMFHLYNDLQVSSLKTFQGSWAGGMGHKPRPPVLYIIMIKAYC